MPIVGVTMGTENECLEIKEICEKYGYGNVMEWASALWRYDFEKKDISTASCFVPTLESFIKDEHKTDNLRKTYDILVKNVLEGEC